MSSSDKDTAVRRPVTALPFRLHASATCPPPAELACSLAWELGDFDADRAERNLTALAAAILAETETKPAAQLRALGEAVTNMALCARRDGGPRELLIDKALERGHAHPVLIAIVLQEIGRRAGLPVGIVAGEQGPLRRPPAPDAAARARPEHRPPGRRRRARRPALAVRAPGRVRAARPAPAALRARRRPDARAARRAPARHAAVRGHRARPSSACAASPRA